MVTIRSRPASRAGSRTAGRSASNAGSSRWAWESTSIGGHCSTTKRTVYFVVCTTKRTVRFVVTSLVAAGERVAHRADVDGVLAGAGDERLALHELLDELLAGLLVG